MSRAHTTLSLLDPFRPIRREFERQVGLSSTGPGVNLTISESDEDIRVMMDVPGVSDSDISITVHDGHLIIEGERSSATPDGAKTLFNNRQFGKFRRTLKLDDSVDPDNIDAVSDNGVLTISLTRRPEIQPRKVTVRSAGDANQSEAE